MSRGAYLAGGGRHPKDSGGYQPQLEADGFAVHRVEHPPGGVVRGGRDFCPT